MAESFLFTIAESLATKLASDALERASQVVGVYDNLQELNKTLNLVKDVLLDAEQKQEKYPELQTWLKQLKTIFSDAEDMLDEFDCQTLRKKVVKDHGNTKDKVSHFFSSSNPLVFRYKMAQKIKDLTQRLDKVADNRNKFTLRTIDRHVVHTREMTHSSMTDLVVIGREHDKEKIIELLLQQKPNGGDDKDLSVIPVVGMGGLGKTTLAKVVFNDNRIQECFPLKMWVCVSDEFDIKQLIIKIINSANNVSSADAPPPHQQFLNMLDPDQLQNQLKNKLAGQKFLLVLDDVWNDKRAKWIELRNLIKVGAAGSKVLVTTRNDSIGSMMGTVPSHILKGLSQKHSWSLLVKWAFTEEGEEENHPELVKIGKQIVEKCRGVPLAVRTLGSLLYSMKFEVSEWEYVRDNEIWNLPQEKDDILPVLKLSYDLLPSYLRQCFALFSLYPKDYDYFNTFEVTTLWGALGLLESPKLKNCTLGEVANQYLKELVSRSFLEDFVQNGNVYGFRIHDLMHDLALMVAKDECLLVNSILTYIPENVQHLSFFESNLFDNSLTKKSRAVKTILFPNGAEGAEGKALLKICLSKFKYLRVLDLCGSSLETLPRAIARLKQLRYLDISKSHLIKRLPSSICKLQSLQVLKLDGCTELEELPKGLRKLINLRHLEFSTKQSFLPEDDIASLPLLVHLSIESSHYLESIFGGVKFPALRALNVTDCQSLKSLSLGGENFPKLETLYVEDCDNLDLELCKGYHKEESSKLKLKTVEFSTLSQLVVLPKWLQEAANSLQFLFISNCDNLETLSDWLTTFTKLKTLCLTDCPKLVSLPNNIDQLSSLASLKIEGCPDLCKKYQPDVGEFWPKISRIKDIVIDKPEEEEKN